MNTPNDRDGGKRALFGRGQNFYSTLSPLNKQEDTGVTLHFVLQTMGRILQLAERARKVAGNQADNQTANQTGNQRAKVLLFNACDEIHEIVKTIEKKNEHASMRNKL